MPTKVWIAKRTRRCATVVVAGFLLGTIAMARPAPASLVFDPVPVTSQASSEFDNTGTYASSRLFDGSITPAQVGTTIGLGGQYASSGTGNGVFADNDFNPIVSTDYSSPVSANSIVYAQRTGGGGTIADKVDTIKIWFTASSFTPTLGAGNPANNPTPPGPPDETINITDRIDSVLREYIFPDLRTLTGSHVTMQFIGDAGQNPGTDPGGYEFRLAVDSAVPEPASLSLLGIGCVHLFTSRRRRG